MRKMWKHKVDTRVADMMRFKSLLRRLGRLFELSWASLMRLRRKLKDVLSTITVFARKFLFWLRGVSFTKNSSDSAAEGWQWYCETVIHSSLIFSKVKTYNLETLLLAETIRFGGGDPFLFGLYYQTTHLAATNYKPTRTSETKKKQSLQNTRTSETKKLFRVVHPICVSEVFCLRRWNKSPWREAYS